MTWVTGIYTDFDALTAQLPEDFGELQRSSLGQVRAFYDYG